jgi:hypothetical protein
VESLTVDEASLMDWVRLVNGSRGLEYGARGIDASRQGYYAAAVLNLAEEKQEYQAAVRERA